MNCDNDKLRDAFIAQVLLASFITQCEGIVAGIAAESKDGVIIHSEEVRQMNMFLKGALPAFEEVRAELENTTEGLNRLFAGDIHRAATELVQFTALKEENKMLHQKPHTVRLRLE